MRFGNPFTFALVDNPQLLLTLFGGSAVASGYVSPNLDMRPYQSFILKLIDLDPAATTTAPAYGAIFLDWLDPGGAVTGTDLYEINANGNFADGSITAVSARIKGAFLRVRVLSSAVGNVFTVIVYGSNRIWAGPPWINDSPAAPVAASLGIDNTVLDVSTVNPGAATTKYPGRFLSGASSAYLATGAVAQTFSLRQGTAAQAYQFPLAISTTLFVPAALYLPHRAPRWEVTNAGAATAIQIHHTADDHT